MSTSPLGTVLVTGGAGFIGSAISQKLADSSDRWVVIDNLHPQVHPSQERPKELHSAAELVVGDVTDPSLWDSVLAAAKPDTIIHLAAETGTAQSLHEATRHAEVNVVGTTVMLDALGRAGQVPPHFVLSSSRAIYGEGEWLNEEGTKLSPGQRSHAQFERAEWDFPTAVPLPSSVASTTPAPTSVYGATKLAQEFILSAWASAHDSHVTVLRLQNVYGPGQSLINSYTGIVTLFSQIARRGESIPIYEDGRITRDFVFIDDIAEAFKAVVLAGPSGPLSRFDVGSGVGTTIMDLASDIARYHGAPDPHITGAYRDGDVRHAECSIEATLRSLDWAPAWSVERGIASLQQWIAAQD
ncbi:NAD-dependent epimerase/dehydratase family protein [Cryobacterium sp. PH31-AA6]|uniref:NAD-dependent epimerase/dehydratase family protein n=1 Tax=Cryobacterium sp. PH31-AA6 TaxID=3046205 RepID=UPI0024BA5B04|nr:NAD-dependent epimerase/dehydratase family protein [Cryobacterium sp. PH31-AA6]MDJ0324897.1 NAD-dependent epimerase/dehydratase family protein [Cryobacterium sp. PH31-AA6]